MTGGRIAPERPAIVDLVVDASVAVKWFVPEVFSAEALRLLDDGFRRLCRSCFIARSAKLSGKRFINEKS